MKLGDLIVVARKRLPKFRTVKSLADEVGVSLEHMRRVESNDSRPSGQLLLKVIDALEMPEKEAQRAWVLLAKEQIDTITRQRADARKKLLDTVNPILNKYVDENNISFNFL